MDGAHSLHNVSCHLSHLRSFLLLNLPSVGETVWFSSEIWTNEKQRNWRFSIYGIYREPAIS